MFIIEAITAFFWIDISYKLYIKPKNSNEPPIYKVYLPTSTKNIKIANKGKIKGNT